MKNKSNTTPRTIESMRTIGHLRPTTQRNQRRPWLSSDDRFTLAAMAVAVLLSVLVWLVG
jgi:hypothetical protein